MKASVDNSVLDISVDRLIAFKPIEKESAIRLYQNREGQYYTANFRLQNGRIKEVGYSTVSGAEAHHLISTEFKLFTDDDYSSALFF